jgi:hypothetical protein
MPNPQTCSPPCSPTLTQVPGPQGLQGAPGIQGITGPTGAAGAPGQSFNWRGQWLATNSYNVNDGVFNNGSAWVAIQPSTNIQPVAGSVYWSLVAQQGGQGPQGQAGTVATNAIYGAGTAYTLTAALAAVILGTTSPVLVLPNAGTYVLFGRARFDTSGQAVTNNIFLTTQLYCTNNTVGAVSNTTRSVHIASTQGVTGLPATYTAALVTIPPVVYTATAGDNITLYAAMNTLTLSGGMTCVDADIFAIQIA